MRFGFTSTAHQEIRTALLYYNQQEPGLGAKFLDEIEACIERILAMPEAWRPLSKRTRRCLLHKFPYEIFYQVRRDEILIVSLMDLRRDPTSWKDLL